jgi:hypothetical protein
MGRTREMHQDDHEKPMTLLDLSIPAERPEDAGLGPCIGDTGPVPSDRRIKHSVSHIGMTVLGLPLYRFSYVGRDGVFEGVMAQDVMQVLPEAVTAGSDGILRVDYGRLGIAMRRVV